MNKPEIQTLSSSVVYKNRWMTVREDKILRADGSPGLYGVVEKADFAIVAAVQAGMMYLVEQYRYPVQGRFLEFPQGTCDSQHMDPLALARAELQEETGLRARHMVHVARLHEAYGFTTQAFNLFLATDLEQGPLHLEPEEQGLVCKAFEIQRVREMICDGTITDSATVASFGLLHLKQLI